MKKLIVLFATLTLICQAEDSFREFTSQDGRKLKAKVISYDASSDKVKILREDQKTVTVNSTVFSEKDQAYIKDWSAIGIFTSTSKLKLDINRNEVKSSKKEREADLGERSGGGRRGGGDTGVQVVAVDKNTQYKFDLLLENKGGVPLKNLTMEYRIYYEQEKAVKDEKANEQRREDDRRPERYLAQAEDKVKDGKVKVGTIEPGESKEVSTGSVIIMKRSASRVWDPEEEKEVKEEK